MNKPYGGGSTDSATSTWDIFLAHAGTALSHAERLYDLLKDQCRVFLDSRCLLPGANWDVEIPRAQSAARVTVVLVTGSTAIAYYEREEIAAAIALARHYEHRVVPVFVGKNIRDTDSVPYGLRVLHGINIDNAKEMPRCAEELLNLVTRLGNEKGHGLWPSPPAAVVANRASSIVRVIFESQPVYPNLGFSIVNEGSLPIQVTSIRVLKAVSLTDDHNVGMLYVIAPRAQLEFSLDSIPTGSMQRVFGDDCVGTIEPAGLDAFRLKFLGKDSINLLDLEIEYVSAKTPTSAVLLPEEVIVVHSPRCQNANLSEIRTFPRTFLLKALPTSLNDSPPLSYFTPGKSGGFRKLGNSGDSPIYCSLWSELLYTGVGCFCRDDPDGKWHALHAKLKEDPGYGTVLFSFASLAYDGYPPEAFLRQANDYLQDPEMLRRPAFNESVSIDILRLVVANLNRLCSGDDELTFYLKHLDRMLGTGPIRKLDYHRENVISDLVGIAGKRCIEYLIHIMMVDWSLIGYLSHTLRNFIEDDHFLKEWDALPNTWEAGAAQRHLELWCRWHSERVDQLRSSLDWRASSPRLVRALEAFVCEDEVETARYARDTDRVVRIALCYRKSLPEATLAILGSDSDERVKAALKERSN
jgi:hypothetical protein